MKGMKMKKMKKRLGCVVAWMMVLVQTMTAWAAEAEVDEAGDQVVEVNATISEEDVTWFKVKIPTEVELSFDEAMTASTRASYGDGYVVYNANTDVFVKGYIPADKKVSVSVPNTTTLVGVSDASKSFSMNSAICVKDTMTNVVTAYNSLTADWYSASFEGTGSAEIAAVKMGAEYADAGSTPYTAMNALALNPTAQRYTGNVTFTIAYGDV